MAIISFFMAAMQHNNNRSQGHSTHLSNNATTWKTCHLKMINWAEKVLHSNVVDYLSIKT